MVCADCERVLSSLDRRTGKRLRPAPRGDDAFGGMLCARCGALVLPQTSTESMLRKISQLASFGLSGGGEPLLERRRRARAARVEP